MDGKIILTTDRLILREMNRDDRAALCAILQDRETMYAYEHAFSDQEVDNWLENQLNRYRRYGYGLWAVVLRETGETIGQCGLTMQSIGTDEPVVEIGYLLNRAHWGKGYATEAAQACKAYAFHVLGIGEVYSIIRENNAASLAVARRNGMSECGRFVKHYMGIDMPHVVMRVERDFR